MNFIKKALILSSAIAFSSHAFAQEDATMEEKMSKKRGEVKELRGYVKHGMGGHLVRGIELTEEQLAAFELGLTEIHDSMPAPGDATMEEMVEAQVAAHDLVKELLDSILTDEQKAEIEAKKAEREAKRAEREAEREAAKAEWEAAQAEREAARAERQAEREAAKAEWEAMSDEEKEAAKAAKQAEREAAKAEREAARAERQAEREAKRAEWEAMTDEEKEAARAAKKAEREAKRAEKEAEESDA